MKKRFVCALLTLIMLLSLIPVGASAASHKTSEAAITVLKQMTTFKDTCYYYSGSEFRTGYGTVCEKTHHFKEDGTPYGDSDFVGKDEKFIKDHNNKHTITEKNADTALRKALVALDEKVCAFETANGLSLKQNQHDALVVFSYNAGTGWMSGNGVLKSVIINKGSATELLNAMNLWTNNADLSRRKVEVNMYVNGIYSNTAPSSFSSVTYDPNGGSMPQNDKDVTTYTYYYDASKSMDHPVTPTKTGAKFLGWYKADGSILGWVPNLTKDHKGATLTALWQAGNTPVTVNYQLHKSHVASAKVYKKTTDEKYDKDLTKDLAEILEDNDDLFWVDRDLIDAKGVRWSRIKGDKGWVKVGAASDNDSFKDSNGTVIATATVTVNGYLNLRKDAGTDNAIIGALAKNDTVNLYEIKTVNGHQWGRSSSGWLCLTYTRLILKDDVSISDEGRLAYTFTGKSLVNATPVHVEPGSNTNHVTYTELSYDAATKKKVETEKDVLLDSDDTVIVTNLSRMDGTPWAKITWKHDEPKFKDSKKPEKGTEDIKVNRSGWIQLSNIKLDPVTYTTVADSVSVRKGWGDASELVLTLNKGVQVEVQEISLIGENIWGRIVAKNDGTDVDGYVNLASKYFSRNDAPTVEEDDKETGLIATVINTDSLRVRKTGATYGIQIGSLRRGTTVAVWEDNGKGWYKVDSNQNGTYDYKEDGWCSEVYLDVRKGSVNGSSTVTDSNGNKYQTDGTGKGIVANTYAGVNVRTGPGTGYGTNGKLLPGTVVEILETKNAGKWGRVAQGWICMDYVTMVSYNEVVDNNTGSGTTVGSYDEAQKTTTTAIYTGTIGTGIEIYRNPTKDQDKVEKIRTTTTEENVTIYELAKVVEVVESDEKVEGDKTTSTTTTFTSYWARINDGWIENPEASLTLDALDEKVHTQTGASKLNVRKNAGEGEDVIDVLVQGDQVNVTALKIIKDKVWGRIETSEGTGWIRLDYMSEGEVYVKAPAQNNPTTPTTPVLGNGSSTGGYVDNASGYRYTGKVIRANSLKVRATPSVSAKETTTLSSGQAMVIYETTINENMAWGRCDAGWVYLYYVDLTPVVNGAVDARVVYNDNTIIYTDVNCSAVAGTYSRMSTIDIYEIVGKMARTDLGWVNTDNLL